MVPLAAGYLKDESGNYVNANKFHSSDYTVWLGNRKGPGRITNTAQVLFIWDQALYAGSLVNMETLEFAFSPQTLNDGGISHHGFGGDLIDDPHFGKIVSQTGYNLGYKTLIMRFINQNNTLILLNNIYHEANNQLVESAVEALKKW